MNEGPPRRVLRNPAVRWAVEPAHADSIRCLDADHPDRLRVPYEGDVLTLGFLVDPITGLPCRIRVVRIDYVEEPHRTVICPVVARAPQD